MRIACLHLPSLPLQAFLRGTPRWLGAPVAVLDDHRRVVACSRAAWAAGVRPGTSGLAAHELVPGLVAVAQVATRPVVCALAEALLAASPRVDLGVSPDGGAHHALWIEVPAKTRGATFGARLVEIARAQGLRARVGIADDRFTAWVAASTGACSAAVPPRRCDDVARRGAPGDVEPREAIHDVITVPRGGSAAFLAPLPLSLLAISAEVQHVLGALGVRTLGEFATLPPPSPLISWEADYQALARGDGGSHLTPFTPSGEVIERVEIGGEVSAAAALDRVAMRVAGRLAGRGSIASSVVVRTEARELEISLAGDDLADACGRALHDAATFVEIEVRSTISTSEPAPVPVPVPVPAEASGPVAQFRLTAPDVTPLAPREHRRTQRGKQRPRVTAQARLDLTWRDAG